jgi:hypothetical protein
MKIMELFAEIGLKGAANANMSLKGLAGSSLALKTTIVAAVIAMERMSAAARAMAVDLDKYEKLTGKSADQLQELKFMAEQAGISGDELAGTIQSLQKARTDILLGKGNITPFMMLGIDPNTDPVEMLEVLRRKIGELPVEIARNNTGMLGISDDMFYMLSQSGEAFEKLQEKYKLTEKNRKDLLLLNTEWRKLWVIIKNLSAQFQAVLAPSVRVLVRGLSNLVDMFKSIGDGISYLFDRFEALKAIAIGAAIALAAYFAPVTLAITAIVLLIEDIWVALNGGDSLIGSALEPVTQFFADLTVWIENLIYKIPQLWESFKAGVEAGLQPVIDKIAEIREWIEGIKEGLKNLTPGKAWEGFKSFIGLGSEEIAAPKVSDNAGGNISNDNKQQTVNNYIQSTGDTKKDADIAAQYSDAILQSPALAA